MNRITGQQQISCTSCDGCQGHISQSACSMLVDRSVAATVAGKQAGKIQYDVHGLQHLAATVCMLEESELRMLQGVFRLCNFMQASAMQMQWHLQVQCIHSTTTACGKSRQIKGSKAWL